MLQDCPQLFVSVAEHDPLRDSGVAYAEALKAANVPVVLDMGKGLIHGYLRGMDYCVDSMNMLKDFQRLAVQNAA